MKTDHLIALFVVLWAVDAWSKSHAGTSAYDAQFKQNLANFQALEGTNFTNSVWDPVSGQPAYQFGSIYAPGGDGVMGTPSYSGAFGHM
jgi:hypothetical protein